MICFPNCKLNIGLYVTAKRADGYHDIETVFYPIRFMDVLEIVPSSATTLTSSGLAVGGDPTSNLVWKAYYLLQIRYPEKIAPVDIFLHKVIPMGAGLGGGSADGAFMLRLLNDFFHLDLTTAQLCELALQLGSDCPVFIENTPVFAQGRGELFTDMTIDLSGYDIQLIYPHIHISTASAFQQISPQKARFDLKKINDLPITEWRQHITNDFEAPVFRSHPDIEAIKAQLYDQGAVYAAMSGSGSTVYGIMRKGQKANIKSKIPITEWFVDGIAPFA